jgi:hypothetical protein
MDHEQPHREKFMGLYEPFTILKNVRVRTSSYLAELARNLHQTEDGLFAAMIRARVRLM